MSADYERGLNDGVPRGYEVGHHRGLAEGRASVLDDLRKLVVAVDLGEKTPREVIDALRYLVDERRWDDAT